MTVQELKNTLDLSELKNNTDELIRDILSSNDIIELEVASIIKKKFNKECSLLGNSAYTKHSIKNENVLNILRDAYKLTKNNFVKSVLLTVGKSKQFSEKQIDVICEEMAKLNTLELN